MRTNLKLSQSMLIAAAMVFTAVGSTMVFKNAMAQEAATVEDFSPAASQQMDGLIKKGQAIIANRASPTAERMAQLKTMILENFDINAVGRFLLGPNWRTATDVEKAELINLIQTITINAYSARLNDYALYKFVNKGAQMDGKSALVFYEVIRPNNPTPINLQWRMIRSPSGPKVVDAIVEGISLGVTQQQDFSSIIASKGKGVQGLLEELRARAERRAAMTR